MTLDIETVRFPVLGQQQAHLAIMEGPAGAQFQNAARDYAYAWTGVWDAGGLARALHAQGRLLHYSLNKPPDTSTANGYQRILAGEFDDEITAHVDAAYTYIDANADTTTASGRPKWAQAAITFQHEPEDNGGTPQQYQSCHDHIYTIMEARRLKTGRGSTKRRLHLIPITAGNGPFSQSNGMVVWMPASTTSPPCDGVGWDPYYPSVHGCQDYPPTHWFSEKFVTSGARWLDYMDQYWPAGFPMWIAETGLASANGVILPSGQSCKDPYINTTKGDKATFIYYDATGTQLGPKSIAGYVEGEPRLFLPDGTCRLKTIDWFWGAKSPSYRRINDNDAGDGSGGDRGGFKAWQMLSARWDPRNGGKQITPPSAVTFTNVTTTGHTVNWTAATLSGGATLNHYDVERNRVVVSSTPDATTRSVDFPSGFTAGQQSTYRVRGVGGGVTGSWSQPFTVTQAGTVDTTAPAPPAFQTPPAQDPSAIQIHAVAVPPTTDGNGGPLADLDHLLIGVGINGATPADAGPLALDPSDASAPIPFVVAADAAGNPLATGQSVVITLRAVDTSGNISAAVTAPPVTLTDPQPPPAEPHPGMLASELNRWLREEGLPDVYGVIAAAAVTVQGPDDTQYANVDVLKIAGAVQLVPEPPSDSYAAGRLVATIGAGSAARPMQTITAAVGQATVDVSRSQSTLLRCRSDTTVTFTGWDQTPGTSQDVRLTIYNSAAAGGASITPTLSQVRMAGGVAVTPIPPGATAEVLLRTTNNGAAVRGIVDGQDFALPGGNTATAPTVVPVTATSRPGNTVGCANEAGGTGHNLSVPGGQLQAGDWMAILASYQSGATVTADPSTAADPWAIAADTTGPGANTGLRARVYTKYASSSDAVNGFTASLTTAASSAAGMALVVVRGAAVGGALVGAVAAAGGIGADTTAPQVCTTPATAATAPDANCLAVEMWTNKGSYGTPPAGSDNLWTAVDGTVVANVDVPASGSGKGLVIATHPLAAGATAGGKHASSPVVPGNNGQDAVGFSMIVNHA